MRLRQRELKRKRSHKKKIRKAFKKDAIANARSNKPTRAKVESTLKPTETVATMTEEKPKRQRTTKPKTETAEKPVKKTTRKKKQDTEEEAG